MLQKSVAGLLALLVFGMGTGAAMAAAKTFEPLPPKSGCYQAEESQEEGMGCCEKSTFRHEVFLQTHVKPTLDGMPVVLVQPYPLYDGGGEQPVQKLKQDAEAPPSLWVGCRSTVLRI